MEFSETGRLVCSDTGEHNPVYAGASWQRRRRGKNCMLISCGLLRHSVVRRGIINSCLHLYICIHLPHQLKLLEFATRLELARPRDIFGSKIQKLRTISSKLPKTRRHPRSNLRSQQLGKNLPTRKALGWSMKRTYEEVSENSTASRVALC
jgi:hypothetical protein